MEHFLAALQAVSAPTTILAVFGGTALGIVIGALPGLGTILALSILLPFTFVLDQATSLGLLVSVYGASIFGGSISAILVNTPGTPQSAATLLDGYPMAQKGGADRALGWATIASFVGGMISVVVLFFAAAPLAKFALVFGPVEYFALGIFSLTCIISVSKGNMIKGILSGLLGLFIATIGQDPAAGDVRFDFGIFELSSGIGIVPLLVGIFALSEVLWRVSIRTPAEEVSTKAGFTLAPFSEWRGRIWLLIKSSLIGTWIGTLPGVGATAAALVSYVEAKRTSPNREKFGTGEPDGIIAAESANNATTGGALVPTLALGVPGDASTAVMLGALVIQGVIPGPRLFTENTDVVYTILLCLLLANISMLILARILAPAFTRILRVPEPLFMGLIVVLVMVGTYSVNNSWFDLVICMCAALLGFSLRVYGFPLAPVVIGYVLSPIIEVGLRQGLVLSRENFWAFFQHPIAVGFFLLTLAFLLWPWVRSRVLKEEAA